MIHLAEGAGAGGGGNLWAVIIGAIASIVVAFVVPVFTLRTSNRSVAQQQQTAMLQQGNALYDRLQKQCDDAERERDEARREVDAYRKELNATLDEMFRLKHRVWAAGYDPETIGREPPHARPEK